MINPPTPGMVFPVLIGVRLAIVSCLATLAACCPPPPVSPKKSSRPVTDSMDVVLAAVDRNALAVPTLWTQFNYSARIVDRDRGTADALSGDGTMMFRRPGSLAMELKKDVLGNVFEMGTNDAEFWVKQRVGRDAWNYYWGHHANVDRPCCRPLPIRPDLVVQVLGVSVLGNDYLKPPVPVMRYDPESDAYVFDFNVRGIDRWRTEKEIWYDAGTKLPEKVILYGPTGRPLLVADLSAPGPVAVPGLPADQSPQVARHYDLQFPDTGSRMNIDFINPAPSHAVTRRIVKPDDHSFDRPDPDANNTVIQIDKDCPDAGPTSPI